jgi:hypothetical protein
MKNNSITKLTIYAAFIFALSFTPKGQAFEHDVHDEYRTKFGLLSQDYPSTDFYINGKLFLTPPKSTDENSENISFTYEVFGIESKNINGKIIVRRIITAYNGGGGGCLRQFLVMDFTGTKPYVSKPFGYNPDGTACLEFKSVKWGKDVSYIYLEGPMKYAYHTGGAVIGPLE